MTFVAGAACRTSPFMNRSFTMAPTNPSSVVLPPVAIIGITPEYSVTNVVTKSPGSGTRNSDAITGDMKTPAPPGIPGDSRPRIMTGGISTAISIMLIGSFSRKQVETVTSSTAMVATFLFSTVPSTIDTRGGSCRWARARFAVGRGNGDEGRATPAGQTATGKGGVALLELCAGTHAAARAATT